MLKDYIAFSDQQNNCLHYNNTVVIFKFPVSTLTGCMHICNNLVTLGFGKDMLILGRLVCTHSMTLASREGYYSYNAVRISFAPVVSYM